MSLALYPRPKVGGWSLESLVGPCAQGEQGNNFILTILAKACTLVVAFAEYSQRDVVALVASRDKSRSSRAQAGAR